MSQNDDVVTAGDLRGMALFADLEDERLESVAAVARFSEATAGALLLGEGEPADTVRVIVKGRVSLTIGLPGRGDVTVTTLSKGHLLGWSALIPGSRWVASAHALKPCLMVEIPAVELLDLCERDFELGYRLMKNALVAVAERLSETRLLVLDMYGAAGE
jgi:CRP-like cAMP-binding protein